MKPLLKPPPLIKYPTRVEWENEAVDVFVDDDDEALLMTSQDGVSSNFNEAFTRVLQTDNWVLSRQEKKKRE